ncbi:thioredoxin domain-containing protein [Paucibacter sp. APW11]|uniref:Thioredoxin domain-containing protein n=1 Tax=Roseateles aquae TaxID=3077235 RepID=A0ABU3PII4_9BURK|nr:thioredoxin domain-containing protein [Paucibacter sp. APW11]MDT9002343.1 thioredoxin domain-containing protein [Paucibacter sp. APW11]
MPSHPLTARHRARPLLARLCPASLGLSSALLAAVSVGLPGPASAASGAPAPAPPSIEQLVIQLLQRRPELVREALDELQRREQAAQTRQQGLALAAAAKALYDSSDATVLGNPLGDVTLVEFIDYHCGYCKRLAPAIETLIQRDSQLRVLVKHLPILGPESIAAAQLALSAGQGAAAQQLHKALLSANAIDAASLQAISRQFGLQPVDVVAVNRQLGEVRVLSERLGIQGTPALIVGDVMFRGAVGTEELAAAIAAARRARTAAAAAAAAARRPTPAAHAATTGGSRASSSPLGGLARSDRSGAPLNAALSTESSP